MPNIFDDPNLTPPENQNETPTFDPGVSQPPPQGNPLAELMRQSQIKIAPQPGEVELDQIPDMLMKRIQEQDEKSKWAESMLRGLIMEPEQAVQRRALGLSEDTSKKGMAANLLRAVLMGMSSMGAPELGVKLMEQRQLMARQVHQQKIQELSNYIANQRASTGQLAQLQMLMRNQMMMPYYQNMGTARLGQAAAAQQNAATRAAESPSVIGRNEATAQNALANAKFTQNTRPNLAAAQIAQAQAGAQLASANAGFVAGPKTDLTKAQTALTKKRTEVLIPLEAQFKMAALQGRLLANQKLQTQIGPQGVNAWLEEIKQDPMKFFQIKDNTMKTMVVMAGRAQHVPIPTMAPNATAQTQYETAQTVMEAINGGSAGPGLRELMNKYPQLVGPVAGRLGKVEQAFGDDFRGLSQDQQIAAQQMRTRMVYLQGLEARTLFGARVAHQILADFERVSATPDKATTMLEGAMQAMEFHAKTISDKIVEQMYHGMGSRATLPPGPDYADQRDAKAKATRDSSMRIQYKASIKKYRYSTDGGKTWTISDRDPRLP